MFVNVLSKLKLLFDLLEILSFSSNLIKIEEQFSLMSLSMLMLVSVFLYVEHNQTPNTNNVLNQVCVYFFEVVKKYIKNGNVKTRLNNFTCSALTSTKISDSINLTDKQEPIVYLYERYVAACLFFIDKIIIQYLLL